MGYSPRGHQESDMTERLHYTKHFTIRELNGASLAAQLVKNLPAMRETWVQPWVGRIPWRRERPHSSILAWRIPWTVCMVHGVTKSRTLLRDFHFMG